jgi:predicted transcriptional regulator
MIPPHASHSGAFRHPEDASAEESLVATELIRLVRLIHRLAAADTVAALDAQGQLARPRLPRLLTVPEVAAEVGISPQSVRRWIAHAPGFPALKVEGRWRIPEDLWRAWIAEQARKGGSRDVG